MPERNRRAAVHCVLQTTSLAKNVNFKALSYTWGGATERHLIFIDGRQFHVAPNLYIALLYLRHPDRLQAFSIDAICINQSDYGEKCHQVLKMRNIYSRATRVLKWLGTSDSDIDKVMAHFAADDLDLDDEKQRTNLPPGLQRLLGNPWCTRIWVVPEISVAHKVPHVGCGDAWVSWSHFEDAMYLLVLLLPSHTIDTCNVTKLCSYWSSSGYARIAERRCREIKYTTLRRSWSGRQIGRLKTQKTRSSLF